MSEKFVPGWPEGTKEIKKPDGKKEIVLPRATDMNEHSREELAKKASMNQAAKKVKTAEAVSPQFSAARGKEGIDLRSAGKEEKLFVARKVHRRQGIIKVERKKERGFREQQKEKGAENYDRLFER